jgi:hypothetical protein
MQASFFDFRASAEDVGVSVALGGSGSGCLNNPIIVTKKSSVSIQCFAQYLRIFTKMLNRPSWGMWLLKMTPKKRMGALCVKQHSI